MKRNIYLALSVIGLIGPFAVYMLMHQGHENTIYLLISPLSSTYTAVFAADLLISMIVFWIFMTGEARKLAMRNWWLYILASVTVGLSFAFPLFLYFREKQLESS
jgi:hypothetical protein